MKWFCVTLACLGLVGGLIDCTPVSPMDHISETVLLKRQEPQSSIPGVDIMLKFASAFSGALTDVFKGNDKDVIAYTKEVKEIADKIPVDSMPIRPDSFPIRSDLIPKEVATYTKQVQDAADEFASKPLNGDSPSNAEDLIPKPSDAVGDVPKQPEADVPKQAEDDVPKQPEDDVPKQPEGDLPQQPEAVDPNSEAAESAGRKRRAASPIDTKIAGQPRIEDRYLIEAASMESPSGKFVEQPKGLMTSCPNHDGGPVIIMIKKVNKLSFDTANDDDCEDC